MDYNTRNPLIMANGAVLLELFYYFMLNYILKKIQKTFNLSNNRLTTKITMI